MTNEELILQELQKINGRLSALESKVDTLTETVDELKESNEEVRSGVNALLEWAEDCAEAIKFPLPRVK